MVLSFDSQSETTTLVAKLKEDLYKGSAIGSAME